MAIPDWQKAPRTTWKTFSSVYVDGDERITVSAINEISEALKREVPGAVPVLEISVSGDSDWGYEVDAEIVYSITETPEEAAARVAELERKDAEREAANKAAHEKREQALYRRLKKKYEPASSHQKGMTDE